jgi:CDP-diacylglycerol--glycerol-3-phosphate 3-phosphatidyltransferase
MTLANKITVARICLIPIFAASAWEYSLSVLRSAPTEGMRVLATLTFSLAALTDGLDGFIARRWNQRSRLGAVLDPIADKGLMFAAMILLSQPGWHPALPWFFPCIVIGRDLIIGVGFFLLARRIRQVEIRASWTGKAATALQIVCILWVLLQIRAGLMVAVILAAVLTIASGVGYLLDGLRQERISRA